MDGQMDVWEFTPVPFGTAAQKGRKEEGIKGRKAARKERRKEGR